MAGIDLGVLGSVAAPAIAVAGVGLTAVLLVWDLKRPERFLYILLKPNPRSWLFWGAVVLGAAGALFTAWLALGLLDHASVLSTDTSNLVRSVLSVPTILAAAMTTGYTGFLFGQAEGRDLWQSPLLFWHLIVQAFMVGAGALSVAATVIDPGPAGWKLLLFTLTVATAGHVVMVLLEFLGRHPSGQAAAAAHMVVKGRYAREFWVGGVALAVLAAVLSGMSWAAAPLAFAALGGLVAQGALIAYESVFVRAGQDVPLS